MYKNKQKKQYSFPGIQIALFSYLFKTAWRLKNTSLIIVLIVDIICEHK